MPNGVEKVGFIGLGRIGSGIAQSILKAGFSLAVFNRTPGKAEGLTKAGARLASSPRDAAAGADVVVTCLMDDQSVLDAVGGPDGILAGLGRGGVHVGITTISPVCSERLAALHAANGTHYVAAPVVGRPDVAAAGQLRTFVAGDPDAIARCERLFAAYSLGAFNLGTAHGVANSLKLAVNYLIASVIELMGEVYAFGEKSGIDAAVLEVVMAAFFNNPPIKEYAERIRARKFDDAGFALVAGLKDLQLILDASTAVRAPLPFASVVRDRLLTAIAQGLEHKDWSAICEVARQAAGLR
jgi:3-hydroxyisobutyrate dehydrogenase-like beta-hydroxyacid dehydrogenase